MLIVAAISSEFALTATETVKDAAEKAQPIDEVQSEDKSLAAPVAAIQ